MCPVKKLSTELLWFCRRFSSWAMLSAAITAIFFELSVVAIPAYPDAKMLEKLARKQDEEHKEYIKRIANEFGEDTILDLYSYLQEQGKISSMCEVQ